MDTNVAVIANGRPNPDDHQIPSLECRIAAVQFLQESLGLSTFLMDLEGAVQAEYRRHLNPTGQPGVGDRFYQAILMSSPDRVERISLDKNRDGEYSALPEEILISGFDPSDRKFAAISIQEGVPVANCADSDWLNHRAVLEGAGVMINFICGDDQTTWFAAAAN